MWWLSSRHFIDDSSNFMEPHGLGVFQIKKGVLTIGTSTMVSAGSWSSIDCTTKWRNGPAGFQLIGLTTVEVNCSCACVSDSDTNFLTGVTISSYDSDNRKKLKKPRKVKRKGEAEDHPLGGLRLRRDVLGQAGAEAGALAKPRPPGA